MPSPSAAPEPRTPYVVAWVLATVGIVSALLRYLLPHALHLTVTTPLYGSYATEQLQVLAEHPLAEAAHRLGGAAFLALGLLQFSARLRRARPTLHRWAGRAFVLLAFVAAGSGAVMVVRYPYHPGERAPALLFGGLMAASAAWALRAIRRGDVATHRAWMVRAFAAGLGIGTIRLLAVVLMQLSPWTAHQVIAPAFWAGWLVTVGAAEWWLRRNAPVNAVAELWHRADPSLRA